MKEFATWFLGTAALGVGLFTAWLANQNHACAELGARFVRANDDLSRDAVRLELELEATRQDLEQRVLEGRPLPYEERVASQVSPEVIP